MKRSTGFLRSVVTASILCAHAGLAQVTVNGVTWHRELAPAVADARLSGKSILVFFADSKSDASNRSWIGLYDKQVLPAIKSFYVPLLVDCTLQKPLAAQLGVSQPGVAILYNANGVALRLLTAAEIADAGALEKILKSPGAGPTGKASSERGGSPVRSAGGSSAAGSVANALPADQILREHLGQEVTVTGNVMMFEASTGPRKPYILTLTQRARDPVQIVYWEQLAPQIHAGGTLPKRGDTITARGKLTDYRGRLQIKIDSSGQIRLH